MSTHSFSTADSSFTRYAVYVNEYTKLDKITLQNLYPK